MQVIKYVLLGAGFGALMNVAAPGAATAQQTSASSAPSQAAEVADELKALHGQVDALQKRLDADPLADPAASHTDKLYYKGVTLTLGGFGALESIYRSRNETADMASSFSAIPFNNSSAGQTSEFRFSARQSRITALAEGNPKIGRAHV